MELNNDFRVGVDRATAWMALTDLERVAPLLPGAQLQEVEGDEYRGIVKVKVGPIEAQYKGTATLIERDESAGRIVLEASGRDTRGQGDASVTVTVTVAEEGAATLVTASTDLTVSGKVAQFGHGVLSEVSASLVGQFAANLERDLAAASGADRAETNGAIAAPINPEAGPAPAEGPRRIASPEPEPVDLFEAAGTPLAKRLAPVAGALAVVLAIVVLRRRRRASRAQRALRVIATRTPDAGELVDAGRRVSRRAARRSRRAARAGAQVAETGLQAAESGLNVAGDLSRQAARHARKAAEVAAKRGQKAARKASVKAAKKAKRTAAKAAAKAAARAARS